jgi:hypothetical protein
MEQFHDIMIHKKSEVDIMKNGKILLLLAFLAVCLTALLAGCSGGGSNSSGNGGGGDYNPVTAPYIYTYTSSDAEDHDHTMRLYSTALNNPSQGWSDTSSTTLNHTHTMNLTPDQLTSINNAGYATVQSSTATNPETGNSHYHTWNITKAFNQASSAVENHSHDVGIGSGDLANPPAAGVQYTTTMALEHTHTVTLTQAQLSTLNSGGPVTVTSSDAVNPVTGTTHNHTWTNLLKPY